MNVDSLQLHRKAIAFLYQQPVPLDKNENLRFYNEVTEQGTEYPEINQSPQELALFRRSGPQQVAEVRLGSMLPMLPNGMQGSPIFRILLAETGSQRPLKFFQDDADIVLAAFNKVWGTRPGRVQLVEVSFHALIAVSTPGGAVGMLRDRFVTTGPLEQSHLGRTFDHMSIKFGSGIVIGGGPSSPTLPLANGQVEFEIQANPAAPQQLLLNETVKWQTLQVPVNTLQAPPELMRALGGRRYLEVNTETRSPSDYLEDGYEYLEKHVIPFLHRTSEGSA
jgi:hypothetical protein